MTLGPMARCAHCGVLSVAEAMACEEGDCKIVDWHVPVTKKKKTSKKTSKPAPSLTLTQLGERINAYLLKFEHDKTINAHDTPGGVTPYYNAWASRRGSYVGIRYVSYQGTSYLSRAEAEAYLAWLDKGHVGKHHVLRRAALQRALTQSMRAQKKTRRRRTR